MKCRMIGMKKAVLTTFAILCLIFTMFMVVTAHFPSGEMVLHWSKVYDPSTNDVPVDVAVDSNDDIIIVGTNKNSSDNSRQWMIVKLDPYGSERWAPIFYNPTGNDDRSEAVAVDSENNIIVVGWETVEKFARWKIRKYDPSGNLLYTITEDFPPTSGDNFSDKAYDVAVDNSDNSYIVVGYDSEDGATRSKWRVIKYHQNGTKLWSKSFDPNPEKPDKACGVALSSDGHIVVVGTDREGTDQPDWGVKRLDPSGNLDNSCDFRIPLGSFWDQPNDVIVDSQNNIIVVGFKGNSFLDTQWMVMKFNSNCAEEWSWTSDWSVSYDDAHSVAVDSQDNIIVVGSDTEDGDMQWRMIKLDKNGELMWTGTVNPLAEIDSFEMATGVAVLKDDNVVVVGSDDGVSSSDFDNQWNIEKFIWVWSQDENSPNIAAVSQIPSQDNVFPEDEVKVNATVTDNITGVKQVTLIYAYANGSGTWMKIIEMTHLEGYVWNATIPSLPYCTNVTYTIMAEDNTGNTATTEEMEYDTQYHVIPEFPSLLILQLFMMATLLAVIFDRRKLGTKL